MFSADVVAVVYSIVLTRYEIIPQKLKKKNNGNFPCMHAQKKSCSVAFWGFIA